MVVGGFGLRIFVHVVSDRVLGSGYKRGRGSKLAVLLGGWFEEELVPSPAVVVAEIFSNDCVGTRGGVDVGASWEFGGGDGLGG